MKCPHCGVLNPADGVLCTNCGQALASDLPSWLLDDDDMIAASSNAPPEATPEWLQTPGITLPSLPASGQSQELPDWLRMEEPSATPAPAPVAAAQTQELPDWLRMEELSAAPAAAPVAAAQTQELPDWLRMEEPSATPAPVAAAQTQELPDWLRMETPTAPNAETFAFAEAVPAPSAEGLPDWLRATDAADDLAIPADLAPFALPPEDELPAWLRDETPAAPRLDTKSVGKKLRTGELSDAALPAWMRDDAPLAPVRKPGTGSLGGATPVANSGDTLPSWLRTDDAPFTPTGAAGGSTAPSPAFGEAEADGLPSWLRDASPSPAAPTTAQTQRLPENQGLPSWLTDINTPLLPLANEGENVPAPSTDDGTSAWFQAGAAPNPAVTQRLSEQESLPSWLRDDDDGAPATPTAPAPQTERLPSWLDDLNTASPDAFATPSTISTFNPASWFDENDGEGARVYDTPSTADDGARVYNVPTPAPSIADAALPSWLQGYDTSGPATAAGANTLPPWLMDGEQTPSTPPNELLGGLDLPDWLRDNTSAPAATVAPILPTYLQGPVGEQEVGGATVATERPRRTVTRSPERLEAMALLERLVLAPAAEPVVLPVAVRRNWVVPVLNILAAVLVLTAILAALLGPRLLLNGGASVTPAPNVAAAMAQFAALQSTQPVLLAYEWDVRRAAELQPVTDAVLAQLQARQAPLILLSTDPQGALLLQAQANRLSESGDPRYGVAGLGFVNLGYKPGGVVALANFAQRFEAAFAQDAQGRDVRGENTVIQTMCAVPSGNAAECSLERLGMIVVVADEAGDVQAWIEQVRPAAPDVPFLVVTPSELAPQVRPYLTDPAITALLGLGDLQSFVGATPAVADALARRWDATTLGSAVVGVLLLIGLVPALVVGRRARGRGERSVWER